LLTLGNLPTGFALFEGRWQQKAPEGKRKSSRPIWLGEPPIAGKTLYVHWEQGFGDTIQFARYVPMAARAGARVILEVRRQTLDLMASLDGVSCLIEDGDPMPDHDFYCPVVSLPLAFGTTLETIPADVPYLRADPVAVAAWRERLAGIAGKKVGLVFAGSSRKGIDPSAMAADKRRSIALADLAPLAAVPNCAFFSLQFGPPAEQTANPPAGMTLYDYTPELGNFSDAALIENLDLVISVDTATAHLAGALAKPVWLLNKFDTDWRWLLDREDSPWYPTMRIFRQPTPGDWDTPIARVAEELRRFAAA
jgi:hypothetical protein